MKRKILTILLASVCAMSLLAGCGDTDSSKDDDNRTEDVDDENDLDDEDNVDDEKNIVDEDDEMDDEDEMTEEDKVAADTQICENIKNAILLTVSSPICASNDNYVDVSADGAAVYSSLEELCAKAEIPAFKQNICDILGISGNLDDISNSFISSGAKGQNVNIYITGQGVSSDVIVYIPGTDASANGSSNSYPSTAPSESCIYAGNIDPIPSVLEFIKSN